MSKTSVLYNICNLCHKKSTSSKAKEHSTHDWYFLVKLVYIFLLRNVCSQTAILNFNQQEDPYNKGFLVSHSASAQFCWCNNIYKYSHPLRNIHTHNRINHTPVLTPLDPYYFINSYFIFMWCSVCVENA